jgi:GNAT superfamily N-acetyltransferase
MELKFLSKKDRNQILPLICQLNPNISPDLLLNRQQKMFEYNNYVCFGCFVDEQLIGLTSGWMTVRLYSGKQLEVDNFVMDATLQSKGYGKQFLTLVEDWCKAEGFETVELNTYISNYRSHKFYFNQGYKILGFHFQKVL